MISNELHFILEPGYSAADFFRSLRPSHWSILSSVAGTGDMSSMVTCLSSLEAICAAPLPQLFILSLQHDLLGDQICCKIEVGREVDVRCYVEGPGRVIAGTSVIDVNWYLKTFMGLFRNEDSLGRVRSAVWHWEWTCSNLP
jgi:hypothetical protein